MRNNKNSVRKIAKLLVPPIVISALKRILAKQQITFVSHESWEDAEKASEGYDSDRVIAKVRQSAKLVFDGDAVYERDSVVFDEIEYSYPLLAALLFVAANSGSLRLIDFGGSLGSTYQQNRRFLANLNINCEWRIVEQKKIVDIGMQEFTNKTLSFYESIEDAKKDGIDAVLFGSSICYVSNSYDFMKKAKLTQAPFIIFDRTPITKHIEDTFAVQYVAASIYKTSYPIRNFSENNIIKFFNDGYELIEKWVCDIQPDPNTTAMGFIFKRKSI